MDKKLFDIIKCLSNKKRFEIFELIENRKLSVKEISVKLKLAYNATNDYLTKLEKLDLIKREKIGRKTFILKNKKIIVK